MCILGHHFTEAEAAEIVYQFNCGGVILPGTDRDVIRQAIKNTIDLTLKLERRERAMRSIVGAQVSPSRSPN